MKIKKKNQIRKTVPSNRRNTEAVGATELRL